MSIVTNISVAALLLSGCVASGVQVSEKTALQFKEGISTEKEIIAKLGNPTGTSYVRGKKIISYTGFQSRVNGATFIPVVGALIGGADHKISVVAYSFDSTGVLESINYSSHEGGARMGQNPAEMGDNNPTAK